MKNTSFKILGFLFITTFIVSCSTRKDRSINRAFHGMSTKYNVLYNGKVAYNKQKNQLDENYKDDFYTILPIEPLKINEEELTLPKGPHVKPTIDNTSSAGGFEKAEEKAVKAVQKHSMNINGKEKNKQIDDAYLLLGKSRYYDQRFVPALETFNYIIKNYPESKLLNPSRIWAAKSLIRLGNEDEAIEKLDLLLKLKELPDRINHDALTALAMANLKKDSTQLVINLLDSTLLYKTKDHNQKARNLFILGQLYRQQQKIDSSNIIFDQLTNFKKAPYRFKIHSQLERAKNYNKATDDTETIITSLKKLAKNRDNRPFLDGIYYQLGKISIANNNTTDALTYFKKSLHTEQVHVSQKSLAYEAIGNISFDQAKFTNAGSYYDSVLNLAKNKNTKRFRRLIRKRKSLDNVIQLENIVKTNDSILSLVNMSKNEQTAFFNKFIDKLKKQDEIAKIVAQNKKSSSGNGNSGSGNSKKSTSGKFYFYNTQTVGFGQNEFQKIWGDRVLTDNWRISDSKQNNFDNSETAENSDSIIDTTIDETQKYDIEYYLGKIPTDDNIISKLSSKRNKAYYSLGLIYKEKFKKYELASNRLEKLLSFNPDKKILLPTYYHLYKAFSNFDMPKSDFYKNKITDDYSDSKYAKIINNPNKIIIDKDKESPENTYKKTYKIYLKEQYISVITTCNKSILQFENDPIVPKFELLKAYAIAKTTNKEKFIEALQFVATNYPNTEEGIHSLALIASLKGKKVVAKIDDKKKKTNTNLKQTTNTKKRVTDKKKNTKKGSKNLPTNKEMLELIKKKKG